MRTIEDARKSSLSQELTHQQYIRPPKIGRIAVESCFWVISHCWQRHAEQVLMRLHNEQFCGKSRYVLEQLRRIKKMIKNAREEHDVELADTIFGEFGYIQLAGIDAQAELLGESDLDA